MTSLDLQLLTNTLINFFTNHAYLLPNYVPDSKKVSILLWAVKDKPNTFILKIADQKYISDYRIDKNGEAYWKFKEAGENEVIKTNDPISNSNSAEAVDKFTQRQIKHEARTNNSQQFESVSS